MSETIITVEHAATCLPELVERIHTGGQAAILVKGGQPMVRMVPIEPAGKPSNELTAFVREWRTKHPDPDDAFADAIQESRQGMQVPRNPWD